VSVSTPNRQSAGGFLRAFGLSFCLVFGVARGAPPEPLEPLEPLPPRPTSRPAQAAPPGPDQPGARTPPKKTSTLTVTTQPAGAGRKSLHNMLEKIRDQYDLPALAGAIVEGNRLVASGAVGVRKAGDATPVTVNDQFHLGSCTKAMTATLIAQLVEQGKLRWETTVDEVFPELAVKMDAGYRGVTLEQLLTHRGGVPTDLSPGGLWARLWRQSGTPTQQRSVLVEGVLTRAPQARPGTKFIYSNGGYAIAGAMAERVTGRPWEELMRTMLFAPLRMGSAGFGAPGSAEAMDQPWGHTIKGGKITPVRPGRRADNPAAIGPAGTVHAAMADWASFAALHLIGSQGKGSLLKPESFVKMHATPPGGDYAMGWRVARRDWGGRVLMHAGSNTMWFCVTWIAPEKNFAVLVATNAAGDRCEKAADEAAWALIQHYLSGGVGTRTGPVRDD